jgi:hypothetical protein
MLGAHDAAKAHAKTVLSIDSAFRTETYMQTPHYRNPEDADHYRGALLQAGLPQ